MLENIERYENQGILLIGESGVGKTSIIKNIIPENRFWTLNSLGNNNDTDSLKIIDIIKRNNIDIVHVDEMIEGFDSFNKVSGTVMKALYDNNRTWRMVETCHNIWFKPELMKKYDPDGYAFCTPFHEQQTFKNRVGQWESIKIKPSYTIVFITMY